MIKNLPILAIATTLVLGSGAALAPEAGARQGTEQKQQGPSAAEMQEFMAANIEDPVARAAALRKFVAAHPTSALLPVVQERLLDALVEAKAPAADVIAQTEIAVKVIDDGASRAMAYNTAANALAERGEQLDKALDYAQKATAGLPAGEDFAEVAPLVQDTLGWVYFKRGDTEKAVATLATAAAGAKDNQEIWFHLGQAYEKAGKNDPAIDAYTQSVAIFTGEDMRAQAPLEALYSKAHGSSAGLDAKVAAAGEASKRFVAFESRKYERPAPAWELKDLSGKPVKLADFKGKLVVMDFWGSWCPPCRAELPSFQALYDKYKAKGVVFVGMNWERPGAPEARMKAVSDFVAQNRYTFPVVIDHDRVAVESYEIQGFPTVYLIDPAGQIRYRNVGFSKGIDQIIEAQIESLRK